jgi:O-methyltransferase
MMKQLLARLRGNDGWGVPSFEGDGLRTYGKDVSWMNERRFRAAYEVGFHSGHRFAEGNPTLRLEWRVHTALWAAEQAMKVGGDFVECGVNTGILSLAICRYLGFAELPRRFFLFDTFAGIPEQQMSAAERLHAQQMNAAHYVDCYELAQRNFAPWPNAQLVRGTVPDSLNLVEISQVAYLSIDMNIAAPERAALEHFWPRLSVGGSVVLDDMGWAGYDEQRHTAETFAASVGTPILRLPTGQGVMVKA